MIPQSFILAWKGLFEHGLLIIPNTFDFFAPFDPRMAKMKPEQNRKKRLLITGAGGPVGI